MFGVEGTSVKGKTAGIVNLGVFHRQGRRRGFSVVDRSVLKFLGGW